MDQHLLCGFLNSLIVNYLGRLRVTTHVTTAIVEWLPVPTRDDAAGGVPRPSPRSPGGCRDAPTLEDWAHLNARVAKLYQLTVEDFAHVLETFPLIDRTERDARAGELPWTLGHELRM